MYWPSLNKSRTMYRIFTFVLSLELILAFSMPVEFSSAAPYQERINGFRVTQNGQFNINGSVSTSWTTGNLGNTWAEGEWVPYQVVITGVQSQYPGLVGLPDIEVKYDFTGGASKGYPRFVDLLKGVQAGTTQLASSAGYPSAGGTPVVINTRAQAEAAQNDPSINVFNGFSLLNLPNSQVNVPLSGAGSVDDAQRKFIVTKEDLIDAGIPQSTDTIVVYFQLHLSRTFIWSNGLQAGYDVAPTDGMGAYQYSSEPFLSDQRPGSGFFPGSSGHARLNMGSGDKTVPIPIPPEPPGGISGFKWLDENGDGIWDDEEMALSGWRIFVSGEIDGIEFGADVLTDENGRYSFPNLTAGEWIVSEALQREEPEEDGFTQSYPFEGVTLGVSSAVEIDIEGRADVGWDVELNPISGNQNNLNFGNVPPPLILGTISGIKFHDRNANGELDLPEEEGLEGWRIELYTDEDMTIPYAANPFQITDEDGFFVFSDLDLGTYYLKEAMTTEQAAAFQQTAPIPNKFEITVTEENDEVLDLEFGNVALSKITVEKQDDQGETLGGWEFKLFKFIGDPEDEEELDDEDFWELIDTQTTDLEEDDGVITFGGLLPGLYQVRETLKTGWAHIFPTDGIEEVTITAGSTEVLTFTNVELGKITVEKQDDQGETLGGWEFKLFMYDEDSEEIEEEDKWVLIDTKTTDLNEDNGVVTWDNLLPGLYKVVETEQDGWMLVTPLSGEYEITLTAGSTENRTFVNRLIPKIDCYDETAWGFNEDTSIPFTDLGFSNWGWTNRIEENSTVTLKLYAGAGQNDISKGDLVGEVLVEYYDGSVTATYTMFAPYELAEAHLWIGETELPLREKQGNLYMTNAPGQFNYTGNVVNVGSFEGDIFVAAHAVAVIPCEEETAITSFYFSEEIFFEVVEEPEIPGGVPGELPEEELELEDEEQDIDQEQKEPEEEIEVEEPGETEEPDESSDVAEEDNQEVDESEEEEDSGRPENPGGHGRGRNK